MSRRHNPIRIKADYSYTAVEIAAALNVTITTVRKWVSRGLKPFDRHVPHLFHGRDIQAFIRTINAPRVPLEPGEFYCVCCKCARLPARSVVWLTPRSPTTVDFTANCGRCGRRIFRRVRISEVHLKLGSARLTNEDVTRPVSKDGQAPHTALAEESVL